MIAKFQILSHILINIRIKKYRLRQFIYELIFKRNSFFLPDLGINCKENVLILIMKHVTGGTNSATKTLIKSNPSKCYFILHSHKELVDVEICYEGKSKIAGTGINVINAIDKITRERKINKILIQLLRDYNLPNIVN